MSFVSFCIKIPLGSLKCGGHKRGELSVAKQLVLSITVLSKGDATSPAPPEEFELELKKWGKLNNKNGLKIMEFAAFGGVLTNSY